MKNRKLTLTLLLSMATLCGFQTFAQKDTTSIDVKAPIADYSEPKFYQIKDIVVHGLQYYDQELLTSTVGLYKGDSLYIPSSFIGHVINKLWNMRIFSDVKVLYEPLPGDSVNIAIYLKERPRVYTWDFSGLRQGEKASLLESMKLRRGTELSDYAIEKNKDLIRKFYAEKGFLKPVIETKIITDTTVQNGVKVVFDIDKGRKIKIGKITFEGNNDISDGKLRRSLKKIHPVSFKFWNSFKFKDKEYEESKENMIDLYNSKGYRNANIVSDSIYYVRSNRMGINFRLEENDKYYIRNITWVGNSKYETEQLALMLGVKGGDIYDKKTIHQKLGIWKEPNMEDISISNVYQNEGYLFFQVDPAETIIGRDSIDIELKIFEGKQARINEVRITGNNMVNDHVVRRELDTRPGDLYSRALLMSSLRRLAQMQYFSQDIQPDIQPISAEKVNVGFPLEEVESDKVELSGGWGAGMFVGAIGLELKNVSIKNFLKLNEWRPYPHGQGQQLSIRGQSNGTYYKSVSMSFTEPWLGGHKPHSLTVGGFYSNQTNAYYITDGGTSHFTTIGFSAGIGRRLSWPDQYFTMYNELSFQNYNMRDWANFALTSGTSTTLALKTVIGRNSVDNPLFPRRGSDFSISLAITPPYSLFDGKDYSNTSMSDQERYRWIEYHKWQLKSTWYYPISRDNKLVLMARMEMGYVGSFNQFKPSPFENFEVGGDGMSGYNVYGVDIIGLRGYENGSLTPGSTRGIYARAYNKYMVELRFPFMEKSTTMIYGLAFVEGGNAFADWSSFDPFLLKRSAGLGVRLFLPMVGLIGVDWGYGFDRVPATGKRSGGQPHFMIGMQF